MSTKRYPKYSAPLSKDNLKFISYCPICNTYFSPLEASVLEEVGDMHLLHFMCRRCSSSIVILVLSSDLGVSSFGLVTDLTGEDVLRFKCQESITTDDVIAVHSFFNELGQALPF